MGRKYSWLYKIKFIEKCSNLSIFSCTKSLDKVIKDSGLNYVYVKYENQTYIYIYSAGKEQISIWF